MSNQILFSKGFKSIHVSILGLCLFSSEAAFSQRVNFSGWWSLKNQESISGTQYSNAMPKQIRIVQSFEDIMIEKVSDKGDGTDITSSETVGFDGKLFETFTTSKRGKVIIIKWADNQKNFTETTSIHSNTDETKTDFKVTDTWALNEDGKQLILVRRNENFTNGETWECKAWYEKQ